MIRTDRFAAPVPGLTRDLWSGPANRRPRVRPGAR